MNLPSAVEWQILNYHQLFATSVAPVSHCFLCLRLVHIVHAALTLGTPYGYLKIGVAYPQDRVLWGCFMYLYICAQQRAWCRNNDLVNTCQMIAWPESRHNFRLPGWVWSWATYFFKPTISLSLKWVSHLICHLQIIIWSQMNEWIVYVHCKIPIGDNEKS